MSEILERLLLIAFGLSLVVLTVPLFLPFIENSAEVLNTGNKKIIDQDLEQLNRDLEKYHSVSFLENISNQFSFSGKISIAIEEENEDYKILVFRFYNTEKRVSTYKRIKISGIEDIIQNSVYIREYTIFSINTTFCIRFF